jgi:hypothetical protein
MKRMPRGTAAGAAATGLITLLAACGSGSPAAAGSPGSGGTAGGSSSAPSGSGQAPAFTGQGTAVDACKLLTPAEVKLATGETIGPFKPSLPGIKNVCIALTSTGTEVNVSVHQSSPQTFGIAKPSGTQAISGLGDRAYCEIGSLVWVLKGSQELGVSASTCAQAAALARIALTRL